MSSSQTDRLDGLSTSTAVKAPVRVVSTANIIFQGSAPYGFLTIDGVTVSDNWAVNDKWPDRVLLVGQTDTTQNGIWEVSRYSWRRASDFDGARDASKGTRVYVAEGSVYQYSEWVLTSDNPVIFGTSSIAFEYVEKISSGTVTSNSLTTAAGSTATITVTDSRVTASTSVIVQYAGGTNTGGMMGVPMVSASDGGFTISVDNTGLNEAFNGTLIFDYVANGVFRENMVSSSDIIEPDYPVYGNNRIITYSSDALQKVVKSTDRYVYVDATDGIFEVVYPSSLTNCVSIFKIGSDSNGVAFKDDSGNLIGILQRGGVGGGKIKGFDGAVYASLMG